MVEKTKRHIENYKKQDIFADATQAREGIETLPVRACTRRLKDATQAREGIETKIWIVDGLSTATCPMVFPPYFPFPGITVPTAIS